jgi:hypothetical protein
LPFKIDECRKKLELGVVGQFSSKNLKKVDWANIRLFKSTTLGSLSFGSRGSPLTFCHSFGIDWFQASQEFVIQRGHYELCRKGWSLCFHDDGLSTPMKREGHSQLLVQNGLSAKCEHGLGFLAQKDERHLFIDMFGWRRFLLSSSIIPKVKLIKLIGSNARFCFELAGGSRLENGIVGLAVMERCRRDNLTMTE